MTPPPVSELAAGARRLLSPDERFDTAEAVKIGDWLEKHERWPLAWSLWARASRRRQAASPFRDLAPWDGGDLTGRRLIVSRRMRHVGAELRLARLLPRVVEAGGACVAYLDPRFAPLARRSYPGVDVRILADLMNDPAADFWPADQAASFEDLGAAFLPDRAAVVASWRPLVPDPRRVSRARGLLNGPGIGFSWASDNPNKRLPELAQWMPVLDALPGCLLSLQYSPKPEDLALFHDLCGGFVHDPSVDPRHDLEGHAAHIAAVDVVVTVSNTAAYMTGALGKPGVVILDDEQIGIWPVEGDRVAWYPSLRLVRRNHRPWSEVMDEAAAVARGMIGVR